MVVVLGICVHTTTMLLEACFHAIPHTTPLPEMYDLSAEITFPFLQMVSSSCLCYCVLRSLRHVWLKQCIHVPMNVLILTHSHTRTHTQSLSLTHNTYLSFNYTYASSHTPRLTHTHSPRTHTHAHTHSTGLQTVGSPVNAYVDKTARVAAHATVTPPPC